MAAKIPALEKRDRRGGSQGNEVLLKRAFAAFNDTSRELELAYRQVEKKVERLKGELDRKNRDLESHLAEKEKIEIYLHDILENLATGVIVLDLAGQITLFNRMAQILTGRSRKEMEEMGLAESLVGPAAAGDPGGLGHLLMRLNDRTVVKRIGGKDRSLHLSTTRLHEGNGPLIGGIVLLTDVTEIQRLQQEAERKNRLVAMGEMSANIAHEIRNPLGSIELYASILRKELGGDADREALADNIIAGVKGVNHIVSNLLYYTRPMRPACEPLRVGAALHEALRFSKHALDQKEIRWRWEHHGPEGLMTSDAELLKQIFLNLILNAVQSMADGGELTILSVVRDGTVEYRISDTGAGISEEDLGHIFNPFFSTRSRGTGLGLAIVHHIVATLGGRIDVESCPNEGTTFTLTFFVQEPKTTQGKCGPEKDDEAIGAERPRRDSERMEIEA